MKRFLSAVAICAAALVAVLPAQAAAKRHPHHRSVSQPAPHAYAARPQMACTITGCIPVPLGCHAEMGRSPNGTPTSFDVVVCGNSTLYGIR